MNAKNQAPPSRRKAVSSPDPPPHMRHSINLPFLILPPLILILLNWDHGIAVAHMSLLLRKLASYRCSGRIAYDRSPDRVTTTEQVDVDGKRTRTEIRETGGRRWFLDFRSGQPVPSPKAHADRRPVTPELDR